MIRTTSSAPLPVIILDTDHTIQPPITSSLSEDSVHRAASDLLILTWDFGLVSNPSNRSGGLIQLLYTAVINDTDEMDVPLTFLAASFTSEIMVSTTELNAVTVRPILVVRDDVSVSFHGLSHNVPCNKM